MRFLRASLERLAADLQERGQRLLVRTGNPRVEVPAAAAEAGVSRVTWNRDYGPYTKARDSAVADKSVHRPWEQPLLAADSPALIVDHAERRKLALERFTAARETRQRP